MKTAMRLLAATAVLAAMGLMVAWPARAESIVFPPDAGVVDVKATYGAKADGVTDDTAVRGLRSVNRVPALHNSRNAHLALIEADLSGGARGGGRP